MDNNEIHNIWNSFQSEKQMRSKEELNQLLTAKSKKAINSFLVIISISVAVCIGLITFLVVTILNRPHDLLYKVNNLILCLIAVVALVSSLMSYKELQNNKYNQPLKDWLQTRINLLSKELTGKYSKIYLFYIPILYILTILSIHVYYENKPVLDVLKSGESVYGLIFGSITGLFVSYYSAIKIRKYERGKLDYLKELYRQLEEVK